MMKNTNTPNPYRYTTQDKIVDSLFAVCIGAAIYGLLLAVGF